MARRHLLSLAGALALVLQACAPELPAPLGGGVPEAALGRALQPPPPEARRAGRARLLAWAKQRGPVEAEALTRWWGPRWARPWLQEAQGLLGGQDRPGPQAGGLLAARLLVACANAEWAASEARRLSPEAGPGLAELPPWAEGSPGLPVVAVVAGAAGEVLARTEPTRAEVWRRQAAAVARTAEAGGLAWPDQVERALALGQAIGAVAWVEPLGPGQRPLLPWPSLPPPASEEGRADEAKGLAAHRALDLAQRAAAMALVKQEPTLAVALWWAEGPAGDWALAEAAQRAAWAIASTARPPGSPVGSWPGHGQAGVEPLRPRPPEGPGPSAAVAAATVWLGRLGPPPPGAPRAEAMASAVVWAAWARPAEARAGQKLGEEALQAWP